MSLRLLVHCVPVVGPLVTLMSHGFAEQEAAKKRAGNAERALRVLQVSQRDIAFFSVINTISHLFFTAVCLFPKVAAAVPAMIPWVLGVSALVSLIHAVVVDRLKLSTTREIAREKIDAAERSEQARKDRRSMMVIQSLCSWIKKELGSNPVSLSEETIYELEDKLERAQQLRSSPRHSEAFCPLLTAIETSIAQRTNALPGTWTSMLLEPLWWDKTTRLTPEEVVAYKKSLHLLISKVLTSRELPRFPSEFGLYHHFQMKVLRTQLLLKQAHGEKWGKLRQIVSEISSDQPGSVSQHEKDWLREELAEVQKASFDQPE